MIDAAVSTTAAAHLHPELAQLLDLHNELILTLDASTCIQDS